MQVWGVRGRRKGESLSAFFSSFPQSLTFKLPPVDSRFHRRTRDGWRRSQGVPVILLFFFSFIVTMYTIRRFQV